MSIDRFPQLMTINSPALAAADDYVVTVFALPMSRMGSREGMTIAMEILQVEWYLNVADIADITNTNFAFLTSATARTSTETATQVTADEDIRQSRTFAYNITQRQTTTEGSSVVTFPHRTVLNDGAGNGFLYVGDTLTMVFGNVGGTAITGTCTAKLLYRWVQVPTVELFGVLQSQQAVVS